MELLLQREPSQYGATYGKLQVDGQDECETLEDEIQEFTVQRATGETPDEWVARWKVPGKTAIPGGHYRVVIDVSARFKRLMPHVLGVPGFTGIRIHALNTAAQTEGCLGVGRERMNFGTAEKPVPGVALSAVAFDRLFALLKIAFAADEQIWLTVRNPQMQAVS